MMRIVAIFFFFIIAVIALCFSLLNFQTVEISLYFTSIEMPLAIALTIELFAGIFIGFIAAFIHIMRLKSQFRSLNRQISSANKNID